MERLQLEGVLDEQKLDELENFVLNVKSPLVVLDINLMGADIKGFSKVFEGGRRAIINSLDRVHTIFNLIRDHKSVFVANIGDYALGGGFELALACDYRVARMTSRVGLPEVKLGIFPGWGGCVSLPALIGAENAVTWITTGKMWGSTDALKVGAIDAVSNYDRDLEKYEVFENKRQMGVLSMPAMELELSYQSVKAQVWPKTKHYPAPRAAVDVIYKSIGCTRVQAQMWEIETFAEVAQGEVAKNMVDMFFANEIVKKKGKTDGSYNSPIGVVGAGLMGGGIAYQCASKGSLEVMVTDLDRKATRAAVDECIRLSSKRAGGSVVMSRISTSLDPVFSDAGIVIEAVVEDVEIKKEVLRNLKGDYIVATNTSTIPLARLECAVRDPSRFVGIHFFSPVHKMPLIEIIRGPSTSDETIETVKAFCHKIGKTPIVVNSCTGFFVNRVLMAFMTPALTYRCAEGANVELLDQLVKDFGWPMSPTELEQSVGPAVAAKVAAACMSAYPHMGKHRRSARETFNHMMQEFENEVRSCIDEGVIGSLEEARMAVILGIGYPPHKEFCRERHVYPLYS